MAQGLVDCLTHATEEEEQVNRNKEGQDANEGPAADVTRGGIPHKVAEAHDQIQGAQGGHFIEQLHVVGKVGL